MAEPLDTWGAFVELTGDRSNGPRVAVKDMIAVAFMAVAAGLPARAGRRADADAAAVTALRRAGYAIVGTTRTDAAGFGTTTPAVANPRHAKRAVGGSSGGAAAAVAAGLADVGLGTDTGGSIRIPAAYCDLVAFKPSHGRSLMDGVVPLAPTFDTLGVTAASLGELVRAVPHIVDGWTHTDDMPVRYAYSTTAMEACDPPVAALFRRALDRLPHARPLADPVPYERVAIAHSTVVCSEGLAVHAVDWTNNPRGFPEAAASALAFAGTLSPAAVERARAVVAETRAAWGSALGGDEVLVLPTLPMAPVARHAATAVVRGLRMPATNANIRLTLTANVAGLPVVVMPFAGVSLQFVGAAGRDEWLMRTVMRIADAAALEAVG